MDQNELNARRMLSNLIANAMEKVLEKSENNVPQPFPLIDKKAAERLSTDDYISWQLMLNEWNKISAEGKKVASRLLVLNSHTLVETLNITKPIMEEGKDTIDFLREHPEYKKEDASESGLSAFFDALREDI